MDNIIKRHQELGHFDNLRSVESGWELIEESGVNELVIEELGTFFGVMYCRMGMNPLLYIEKHFHEYTWKAFELDSYWNRDLGDPYEELLDLLDSTHFIWDIGESVFIAATLKEGRSPFKAYWAAWNNIVDISWGTNEPPIATLIDDIEIRDFRLLGDLLRYKSEKSKST